MKQIKLTSGIVWVAAAAVIGLLLGVSSPGGLALLAAFALLPPLAMLVLWNEPQETMSESIRGGQR
jgi:hypothetical protein